MSLFVHGAGTLRVRWAAFKTTFIHQAAVVHAACIAQFRCFFVAFERFYQVFLLYD